MFKALENAYEWAPLPLRIGMAALFLYAGIMKFMDLGMVSGFFGGVGIPAPNIMAPLVAVLEVAGGAFLLLGLWTRISATVLTIILIVATALTLDPDPTKIGQTLQLVALIGGLLMLVLSGPGKWSLDEKFFWE